MSNGRTRSNFEFSVLGSETAAAGPEQLAAASRLEESLHDLYLLAYFVGLLWISLGYL